MVKVEIESMQSFFIKSLKVAPANKVKKWEPSSSTDLAHPKLARKLKARSLSNKVEPSPERPLFEKGLFFLLRQTPEVVLPVKIARKLKSIAQREAVKAIKPALPLPSALKTRRLEGVLPPKFARKVKKCVETTKKQCRVRFEIPTL